MAAWRSTREWKTPRCNRRRVSLAKKPSTALSQDAEVGVKWNVQRGCRASPDFGVLVAAVVVEDHVDQPADWDVALEAIEKAQEFLVPVALHALPDHRAVKHVERREQGRGAVADVIVGIVPARPFFI